ncbi:hypothetical protein PAHAL_8G068600 [Panicum hallii]|uniref:START domain-containing protein n=1 Tax=Panicum hallii TaxID=206008 RepID=A0A2T8I806_9POAL|nr:hypothetical protein PAHAL_8G068600 [Panicum hallii]
MLLQYWPSIYRQSSFGKLLVFHPRQGSHRVYIPLLDQFLPVQHHRQIFRLQQWESDQLVEASYIRELGDDLSIIHLKFGDASSARRRRDLVVYQRRQAMDDGTLVVAVASLPKEIAAGLLPPAAAKGGGSNPVVGRGLLLQSGWVLERLEGADDSCGAGGASCVVTYVVQLDPAAGWLPRCLVGRLNSKLVMIIAKLRRIAQDTVAAAAAAAAGDM